jgi:hypothetical protein
MSMDRAEFERYYEAWGVDSRLDAELEAATVHVPGEDIIVVGFPLGSGREWTLRLESDRSSFSDEVVVP